MGKKNEPGNVTVYPIEVINKGLKHKHSLDRINFINWTRHPMGCKIKIDQKTGLMEIEVFEEIKVPING